MEDEISTSSANESIKTINPNIATEAPKTVSRSNGQQPIKQLIPPRPTHPIKYVPKVETGIRDFCKLLGLYREPFSMALEPDFFYESKQHRECLNTLELSLRLNRGLHVVLGGIGTGKTAISRILVDRFKDSKDDYNFFLILNPTWSNKQELLIHIKKIFNIKDVSNHETDMMNQIEQFLILYTMKHKKRIVIIIDEGQKMGPNQLEIVRTLLNFETNNMKLIQLLIFAQPEFGNTLISMENFKDRIAYLYHLKNIDKNDTHALIDYRLGIAGLSDGREIFTKNAKDLIYKYTNGYPRKIIVTCHNLLIEMIISGKSKVDADFVRRCTQKDILMTHN
jgi:general secretion pathway protein A